MRGAIASLDLYLFDADAKPRRVTLTITAPERQAAGPGWVCRLALADLRRPESVAGIDSVAALASALDRARSWVADLRASGLVICRDRAGETPFEPF